VHVNPVTRLYSLESLIVNLNMTPGRVMGPVILELHSRGEKRVKCHLTTQALCQ
jgi:hypothetical protein